VFLRFFGRGFHGILGGKGSAFPRALEAETPGTAPGYGIPLFIGDVNYGVIKCGVYMAYTLWHIFFSFRRVRLTFAILSPAQSLL
jgi:hypothetical protein